MCFRKYCVSDLSSCAGSELTSFAGSELGSELTSLAENGVNILKLIDEGPFQMGTLRETLTEGAEGALHLGPERPRVYSDLTSKEKNRYNADIRRATNILLQWLPKDIYSLINHYTDANDIWDNVKMLLEGSKLTKEDRESQLGQGNNVWGADAAGYGGAQNRVGNANSGQTRQINATTATENKVALDEEQLLFIAGGQDNDVDEDVDEQPIQDLALNVDNVFQVDDYLVYDEAGPSYDSNILSENRGQGNNVWGADAAGYGGAQNRVGNANSGQTRQINATTATENKGALDEEQLLFIAGGQDNDVDEDVDEQPIQDLALNVDNVFQVDDCDVFDSNVDEAPIAQTMFMVNLSSVDLVYDEVGPSYDSDILSEVHDHYQDDVYEHHEVHEMHDDVQPNYVVDSHVDYTSNSNMIPYD
nr:integrase, catalytic region, zinc finger, CCHC-type, peptidase aspartic, catalytic [Tanacetum cinerariifolium]